MVQPPRCRPLRVVPCDPRSGVLRPGQDGHRQVQHAGLRPALLPGRADQPARRPQDRLRAARLLPRRCRRPADGAAPRPADRDGHRLGRRDRARHRPRDPARDRRPARLRRGGGPHRGAPCGRAGRSSSSPAAARRWSSRSARCSASTGSSPRAWSSLDGRYTGEIDFYAYGENKAAAMHEVAAEGGYDLADCYAYSDSITDLPMLSAVGHPTAVNPDRGLRKAALEHGWPVLQFTRPVSMRARFSVPGDPVVTGAAVGVGAAVVGLAWYARHRALRAGLLPRSSRPVRSAADGGAAAPDASAGLPRRRVPRALILPTWSPWSSRGLAVLAVCVAAFLFGQTARTSRRRSRRALGPGGRAVPVPLRPVARRARRRRAGAVTGAGWPRPRAPVRHRPQRGRRARPRPALTDGDAADVVASLGRRTEGGAPGAFERVSSQRRRGVPAGTRCPSTRLPPPGYAR